MPAVDPFVVRFSSRLELTAKPVTGGAIAARANFETHNENVVDLAVVTRTRWSAPALPVTHADLHGECAGATHVVATIQRGAFAMAVHNARAATRRSAWWWRVGMPES